MTVGFALAYARCTISIAIRTSSSGKHWRSRAESAFPIQAGAFAIPMPMSSVTRPEARKHSKTLRVF